MKKYNLSDIRKSMTRVRQQMTGFDVVCTGTLLARRYSCGKSNCRCQKGTRWHHGPYYDWTRLEDKKFVHCSLTQAQAKIVKQAIKNYKTIRKLLRDWEAETIKLLKA